MSLYVKYRRCVFVCFCMYLGLKTAFFHGRPSLLHVVRENKLHHTCRLFTGLCSCYCYLQEVISKPTSTSNQSLCLVLTRQLQMWSDRISDVMTSGPNPYTKRPIKDKQVHISMLVGIFNCVFSYQVVEVWWSVQVVDCSWVFFLYNIYIAVIYE